MLYILIIILFTINLVIGCDDIYMAFSTSVYGYVGNKIPILLTGCQLDAKEDGVYAFSIASYPCTSPDVTENTLRCILDITDITIQPTEAYFQYQFTPSDRSKTTISHQSINTFQILNPEIKYINIKSFHTTATPTITVEFETPIPSNEVQICLTSTVNPELFSCFRDDMIHNYFITGTLSKPLDTGTYYVTITSIHSNNDIYIHHKQKHIVTVYGTKTDTIPYISNISPTYHTAKSYAHQKRTLRINGKNFLTIKNLGIRFIFSQSATKMCNKIKVLSDTNIECMIPENEFEERTYKSSYLQLETQTKLLKNTIYPFRYVFLPTLHLPDIYNPVVHSFLPHNSIPSSVSTITMNIMNDFSSILPFIRVGPTHMMSKKGVLCTPSSIVVNILACHPSCLNSHNEVAILNDAKQVLYAPKQLLHIFTTSEDEEIPPVATITIAKSQIYTVGTAEEFQFFGYNINESLENRPSYGVIKDILIDEDEMTENKDIEFPVVLMRDDNYVHNIYTASIFPCLQNYRKVLCREGVFPISIYSSEHVLVAKTISNVAVFTSTFQKSSGVRIYLPISEGYIPGDFIKTQLSHDLYNTYQSTPYSYRLDLHYFTHSHYKEKYSYYDIAIDFYPGYNTLTELNIDDMMTLFLKRYTAGELDTKNLDILDINSILRKSKTIYYCPSIDGDDRKIAEWRINCKIKESDVEIQIANSWVVYAVGIASVTLLVLIAGYCIYLVLKKRKQQPLLTDFDTAMIQNGY